MTAEARRCPGDAERRGGDQPGHAAAGTLFEGLGRRLPRRPRRPHFYGNVTSLVSNGVTVGFGGGLYGVDKPTLRQQMAVFLMRARLGLCFVPPPSTGTVFTDVPCS